VIAWERICLNLITGRTAWAVRHIPSGVYGDPYDWSMVVIRRHWFDRYPRITLVQGMTLIKRRQIFRALSGEFKGVSAIENGRLYRWNRQGVRLRG